MSTRTALVVGVTVVCVLAVVLVPPIAQPLHYHAFADHREALGIANFGDVVSNVAFLVVGLAGLFVVFGRDAAFESGVERWPYATFFLGLVLTAIGSAYYHLAPDNARLVWDRLPITITLAGLLAGQIGDRISVRASLALLVPMTIVGVASVAYWRATELAGHGNLVPYAIAQGYAGVALILIACLWPSRYTRGRDLWWSLAWYALAKICESFDHGIFALGQFVSGHTMKHLFAALSGVAMCLMLARRERLFQGDSGVLQSRAAVPNPASIPR